MPVSPLQFKDEIFRQFARIGKALASPKRVELLDVLSQGPRTVEVLARESDCSVANTSRHLQVLRGARLVEGDRSGLFVTYRVSDERVSDFLRQFRLLAEARLAEVDATTQAFLGERIGFKPVGRKELLRQVRAGEVTVLDVRPREEYAAGHLPGAISVPLDDLRKRLRGIPKDREIVAYCRGPHCVLSVEAVELLRKRGYRAQRLDLGVHDWRGLGFDIETLAAGGIAA